MKQICENHFYWKESLKPYSCMQTNDYYFIGIVTLNYHQVVLWLFLSLTHRQSLSSIAPSRSSRLLPVSAQSWCKFLLVSQHWYKSIGESCLWICDTWMVFKMGGKWPCNWCFVGDCFQNMLLVKVQVVHPYNSANKITVWKNSRFILSENSVSIWSTTCQ